jgi:D-threo-aldose 1-dehydrogenase
MLTNMRSLQIDDLVFGCGPVGSYAADGDEATGRAALRAALDAGMTRFDVAPSYGDGRAEEVLGLALEERAPERVVVSTKVGRLTLGNQNPYARPTDLAAAHGRGNFDFSAAGVREALATSLRRLGRERVDVAFVHDPEVALEQARAEAIPALREARAEGVAGAVGVATTNPEVALSFVEDGLVDQVMIANAWSLTRRGAAALLDRCAEAGVSVQAAGPFDSGLLATPRPNPAAPSGYRAATPEAIETASALADLCERHGATLPQAAIQFPLRHPAVSAVVVGMRSPAEVAADLALLTTPVPEGLWEEIDALVA